ASASGYSAIVTSEPSAKRPGSGTSRRWITKERRRNHVLQTDSGSAGRQRDDADPDGQSPRLQSARLQQLRTGRGGYSHGDVGQDRGFSPRQRGLFARQDRREGNQPLATKNREMGTIQK